MTKINEKIEKIKTSPLEAAIFESYVEQELQPLKNRLSSEYRYLCRLYEQDLTGLSDEEIKHIRSIEKEVSEMHQAIAAYDGIKSVYNDQCGALLDRIHRLKSFADQQFQRADFWFNRCMVRMTEADEMETLLSFLTDEERLELERRRDDAKLQKLIKALKICV